MERERDSHTLKGTERYTSYAKTLYAELPVTWDHIVEITAIFVQYLLASQKYLVSHCRNGMLTSMGAKGTVCLGYKKLGKY